MKLRCPFCNAFISLSICIEMIGRDVSLYAKIWPKLTRPLQNADIQSISPRSALAVTPSD